MISTAHTPVRRTLAVLTAVVLTSGIGLAACGDDDDGDEMDDTPTTDVMMDDTPTTDVMMDDTTP